MCLMFSQEIALCTMMTSSLWLHEPWHVVRKGCA